MRSLRFSNVLLEKLSLIAPPKSGNVQLVGPAFRYIAKDGFHGENSFSIEVLGISNKVRGTSTNSRCGLGHGIKGSSIRRSPAMTLGNRRSAR